MSIIIPGAPVQPSWWEYDHIEVRMSPSCGRHVVAVVDIKKGDVILEEQPIAIQPKILTENKEDHHNYQGMISAIEKDPRTLDLYMSHERVRDDYDTWSYRVASLNSFGSSHPDIASVLYLHTSFFNHSCRPNAYRTKKNTSAEKEGMYVYQTIAGHDIPAGTEICISYIKWDLLMKPIEERHANLRKWCPRGCFCAFCTR